MPPIEYRNNRLIIPADDMRLYAETYPYLDILAVKLKAEAYLLASGRRYRNYSRFFLNWLKKESINHYPVHLREAYDLCVGAYGYRNRDAVCKLWVRLFSQTKSEEFLAAIEGYMKDTYTPNKTWPTPAALRARLPKPYMPGA